VTDTKNIIIVIIIIVIIFVSLYFCAIFYPSPLSYDVTYTQLSCDVTLAAASTVCDRVCCLWFWSESVSEGDVAEVRDLRRF